MAGRANCDGFLVVESRAVPAFEVRLPSTAFEYASGEPILNPTA